MLAFSKPLTANKVSCQPLAVLQDLGPTANRKPIHDPLIAKYFFKEIGRVCFE